MTPFDQTFTVFRNIHHRSTRRGSDRLDCFHIQIENLVLCLFEVFSRGIIQLNVFHCGRITHGADVLVHEPGKAAATQKKALCIRLVVQRGCRGALRGSAVARRGLDQSVTR